MRKSPDYALRSLERGIDLLYCLADHPSLSVEALSRKLKSPKSTVYRSLGILRARHLVARDADSARYRLGLGILRVQRALVENLPVRAAALSVMRDLAARSEESVSLILRQGEFGVSVEVIESSERVRVAPRQGESVPLHAGAPMKAILAFLPDEEVRHYLRRRLERFTPRTLGDPRRLRADLALIRARGYAESWEELYLGAVGVAAPILDSDGHAIASLAVSAPVLRMTPGRVPALGEMVMAACKDVRRRLHLAR